MSDGSWLSWQWTHTGYGNRSGCSTRVVVGNYHCVGSCRTRWNVFGSGSKSAWACPGVRVIRCRSVGCASAHCKVYCTGSSSRAGGLCHLAGKHNGWRSGNTYSTSCSTTIAVSYRYCIRTIRSGYVYKNIVGLRCSSIQLVMQSACPACCNGYRSRRARAATT